MSALPQHGFVDTQTVAEHLGASAAWVRQHAHELGAIRLGTTRHGGLRYDVQRVRAAIDRRRVATSAAPAPRRKPGPRAGTSRIPVDVRDW